MSAPRPSPASSEAPEHTPARPTAPVSGSLGVIRKAGDLLTEFRLYVVTVGSVIGAVVAVRMALENPPWAWVGLILSVPLILVVVERWLWPWLRRRRETRLAKEAEIAKLGHAHGHYFRLDPWNNTNEDVARYHRDDGAHQRITEWVRCTEEPILLLTGRSGCGKSSLVSAYLRPTLAHTGDDGRLACRTLVVRSFSDPLPALRDELLRAGAIWQNPPTNLANLTAVELLERAAEYLSKRKPAERLLVIFDQFEELFVFPADDSRRVAATGFFRALHTAPIPGVCALVVAREEYVGDLKNYVLANPHSGKNWQDVPPFNIPRAEAFLSNGKIPLTDAKFLAATACQIDEVPGQATLIALNMLGKVYMDDPETGRALVGGRPGAFLQRYLEGRIRAGNLREVGPAVLRHLVNASGVRQPAVSAEELSAVTGLLTVSVSGALFQLEREGVVRRVGDGRWEVSHDFLARMLNVVLTRIEGAIGPRLKQLVVPVALLVSLGAVGAVAYSEHRIEVNRQEEAKKRETALTEEKNKQKEHEREQNKLAFQNASGRTTTKAQTTTITFRPTLSVAAVRHLEEQVFTGDIHIDLCNQLPPSEEAWVELGQLRNLRSVDLSNCSELTDAGLRHLTHLKDLTALNLSGCYKLTDAGLQHISGLTNLTALNLSGCHDLTNAGLQHISGLTNLTALNLSGCYKLTDAGLQHISGLTNLTALNLSGCRNLTDAGLQHISGLTNLTTLDLNGPTVTDAGIQHISGLTNLTELNLSRATLTDNGLKQLAKLKSLTKLSVNCRKLTDAGIQYVSSLTNLATLALSCETLPDTVLKHIAKLQNLTTLRLKDCDSLTDADLKYLTGLKSLTTLDFYRCRGLTDAGLNYVSASTNLTTLNLYGCPKLTDAGIQHITGLTSLTSLDLSGSKLTKDGLKQLTKLKSLTRLGVEKCTYLSQEDVDEFRRTVPGCVISSQFPQPPWGLDPSD